SLPPRVAATGTPSGLVDERGPCPTRPTRGRWLCGRVRKLVVEPFPVAERGSRATWRHTAESTCAVDYSSPPLTYRTTSTSASSVPLKFRFKIWSAICCGESLLT